CHPCSPSPWLEHWGKRGVVFQVLWEGSFGAFHRTSGRQPGEGVRGRGWISTGASSALERTRWQGPEGETLLEPSAVLKTERSARRECPRDPVLRAPIPDLHPGE